DLHDDEEDVLQGLSGGAYVYLLNDTDKNEFNPALKHSNVDNKFFRGTVSKVLARPLLNVKPSKSATTMPRDPDHLTRREKEILRLVIDGKQNKQIADVLGKSVRTIETHRFNIMKKLGVNNAIDMVNKVVKENLI